MFIITFFISFYWTSLQLRFDVDWLLLQLQLHGSNDTPVFLNFFFFFLNYLQSLPFSISTPLPHFLNCLKPMTFGEQLICHLFIQNWETQSCGNTEMKNVENLIIVILFKKIWKMEYNLVLTSRKGWWETKQPLAIIWANIAWLIMEAQFFFHCSGCSVTNSPNLYSNEQWMKTIEMMIFFSGRPERQYKTSFKERFPWQVEKLTRWKYLCTLCEWPSQYSTAAGSHERNFYFLMTASEKLICYSKTKENKT